MGLRAGIMRDYVTVERNTPTQGNSGEEIDNWTVLSNAWMRITETGGDEHIIGLKAVSRFIDIIHTDRIIFGTRTLDIVSVTDPGGMGRTLTLELREDTSG